MQHCSRCNVQIMGPAARCPLCQGALEGTPDTEEKMFPDMSRMQSRMMLGFKVFTFLCIAVVVLAGAGNLLFPGRIFWAGFVAAAAACVWVLTAVAFRKRRNLLKSSLWEMLLLWGMFLMWDVLTGFDGWSLDYGMPIAVLAAELVMGVTAVVVSMPVSYYMIYFLLAGGAGLVPLLLMVFGQIHTVLPSVLCGTVSLLLLAGFLIFQGRAVKEEIRKKLHLGSR